MSLYIEWTYKQSKIKRMIALRILIVYTILSLSWIANILVCHDNNRIAMELDAILTHILDLILYLDCF